MNATLPIPTPDFDRLESLDYLGLCRVLCLPPKLVTAWISHIAATDEIGIDSAVRDGMSGLSPEYADYAYLVIDHLFPRRIAA